jgi:hypothetical protein
LKNLVKNSNYRKTSEVGKLSQSSFPYLIHQDNRFWALPTIHKGIFTQRFSADDFVEFLTHRGVGGGFGRKPAPAKSARSETTIGVVRFIRNGNCVEVLLGGS